MAQQYSALPEMIPLNDTPPERKRSLSLSSGSDSDMSYRDPLDIEPFDEKGAVGYHDEAREDDAEEGLGYAIEPRRVSCRFPAAWVVGCELTIEPVAPAETVEKDSGHLN